MGFTEILTLIFIALKIFGVISWSWWIVLLPELIALVIYIGLLIIAGITTYKTGKISKKYFDKDSLNF